MSAMSVRYSQTYRHRSLDTQRWLALLFLDVSFVEKMRLRDLKKPVWRRGGGENHLVAAFRRPLDLRPNLQLTHVP